MLEDGQIASLDPLTGKLRWAVAPPMSDRSYLGLVVSSSAGSLPPFQPQLEVVVNPGGVRNLWFHMPD